MIYTAEQKKIYKALAAFRGEVTEWLEVPNRKKPNNPQIECRVDYDEDEDAQFWKLTACICDCNSCSSGNYLFFRTTDDRDAFAEDLRSLGYRVK